MEAKLQNYILKHIDSQPPTLKKIERETNLRLINGRMCSGHLQGRFLKMLTQMIRPNRILELGTFSGFSALCFAEGLKEDATIDTIEINDELEDFIRENLASSPYGSRVNLHIGNAMEIMKQWPDSHFDLIFIDADKRLYPEYYNQALRLLQSGGFIIADNTLWDGHVVNTEKFNDPQTHGVMRFNDLVASDERVEKVILPIRDGLTLIRKI